MELSEQVVTARKEYIGSSAFNLVAGDAVELEIASAKEIEETVPSGKVWEVRLSVQIIETDA